MRFRTMLRELSGKMFSRLSTQNFFPNISPTFKLKLRSPGYICRDSYNECDLPETCSGESGQCPADVYKKNGSPCGVGYSGMDKATGKNLNYHTNSIIKLN